MASSSSARVFFRLVVAVAVVGGAAYYLQARSKASTGPAGAAGGKAGEGGGKGGAAALAARPVPVLTSPVLRKDVPVWLEGLGSVAAFQQVLVKAQVDGKIDKIAFTEGQAVKKGDLLAQIDARPFQVQLQQAEGALARDRAQLKAGELNLDRYKKLVKQDLATTQQLTDQQGTVGQLEGAIRADQGMINAARLNLDWSKVRAPIDGVVGVRMIDAGNIVRATDQTGIVVITQLDPAAVFITLPQDDLSKVVQAMDRGKVAVEVWARDGAAKLAEGTLAVIDNQINQSTATLRLKAVVPNPKRMLWPNQFVKARLLVDTRKDVLVVPAPAVQRGPQGTYVYVALKDGTAEVRKVDVALVTAEYAVIEVPEGGVITGAMAGERKGREEGKMGAQGATVGKGAKGQKGGAGAKADKGPSPRGLLAGEEVITEGQNQLRPGAKVMKRAAADSKPGEAKAGEATSGSGGGSRL
jgi:multidrug efflux system membrane fusion protein